MTITNREYGITQFCEELCEDNEIWHLLAFVRNESGVLPESYSRVNIKMYHYSTLSLAKEMGNLSKHSSRY